MRAVCVVAQVDLLGQCRCTDGGLAAGTAGDLQGVKDGRLVDRVAELLQGFAKNQRSAI